MPSPIGHSLIGFVTFRSFQQIKWKRDWFVILFVLIASNIPDFDFLPGILVGAPNRFHHGISHSFGFVILLTGMIYLLERFITKRHHPFYASWFLILSSIHVVMDLLAIDTRIPYGEPLFWPVSGTYFLFQYPFFLDIRRADGLLAFFPSLFSWYNFTAVMIEVAVAIGVWVVIESIRPFIKKQRNNPSKESS